MSGLLFAIGLFVVLMVCICGAAYYLFEGEAHPVYKAGFMLALGGGLMAAGVVLA